MKSKWIVCLLMFGIFVFTSATKGNAKTYAYLVGDGSMASLDTDTNIITPLEFKISSYATFGGVLAADKINNYMYIRHCVRLGTCKVGVYGLKDLKFIKELPLEAQDHNIDQLIYPDGSKFLIQYLSKEDENDEGGYTTDIYDAKTLTEIGNLSTYVSLETAKITPDSKNIYSIAGGDEAKLYIIDSKTFETKSTTELSQYWRKKPAVFASGVTYWSETNKLLIGENLQSKKRDVGKLDLFVYDIETQQLSKRISTGLQGYSMITPDGNKIILDENQDVRDRGALVGSTSLGKLHIYNIASGTETGLISFPVKGEGNVLKMKSTSDVVYYVSEGDTPDSSLITVINIVSNKVLKSTQMPFKVIDMVFYEK